MSLVLTFLHPSSANENPPTETVPEVAEAPKTDENGEKRKKKEKKEKRVHMVETSTDIARSELKPKLFQSKKLRLLKHQ